MVVFQTNMAEELLVVLSRSENSGFGFSLLGQPGLPPIIYDIVDDSPAAQSGEVEVGDVILEVNNTNVHRLNTKEVLKCLRLSADPVTLKLKRDPLIKACLAPPPKTPSAANPAKELSEKLMSAAAQAYNRPPPSGWQAPVVLAPPLPAAPPAPSNGSCSELEALLPNDNNHHAPAKPKFEAYMMTGEHILNLSRTPQGTHQITRNSHRGPVVNHTHNSVPSSPNETQIGFRTNSAGTSPIAANRRDVELSKPSTVFHAAGYVRNSRSEDHLQFQKDSSMSAVDIEIEDDVTSSLNTLLDTRLDSGTPTSDRIVWTYNAPVISNGSSSSQSTCSSPLHSTSPASPTSVSSSVMSSRSSSHRAPHNHYHQPNGDLSMSEAISNISSPDYHDEETLDILNARDLIEISDDYSDSDSTILVSEPQQKRVKNNGGNVNQLVDSAAEHKIVIQVKGPDKDTSSSAAHATANSPRNGRRHSRPEGDHRNESINSNTIPELQGYQELHNREEDTMAVGAMDEEHATATSSFRAANLSKSTSPPLSSEDESDIESLHSFHYSPKAVDIPSAIRLAKRLYSLDGFKKSDVSRHLSKNNDFTRAVAEEYLKYFSFENDTLDVALRKFLKQFSLTGETQERERVLVHFSKRYLDCNPGVLNSQDAVHTLTCAIMLLNTDLHGQNLGRKMNCAEFIDNLAGLNECENFPREVLKQLYQAIKNYPLEWAIDDEPEEGAMQAQIKTADINTVTSNPFLDIPNATNAIEYKKGYVMRKCCYEASAKRSFCCNFLARFHKRSWKMYYCTLRDLVLYLHKDEHGFRKSQISDNLHNAIRIHHALATKATDYTKKQYVFRLQTADQAEYLFQTSDPKELQSWIDTINFVCASFSSQPLEGGVGSQKKFQRPLLPCSHTKLSLREQLRDHEERVMRLELELTEHRKLPPEKGAKALIIQNYKEKDAYLNYELNRYRSYSKVLRSKMSQYPELEPSLTDTCIGEVDEACGGLAVLEGGGIVPPPVPDRRSPPTNRSEQQSETS